MQIQWATANDAAYIAEIYNWYIRHTIITFETEVVSPQDMQHRIQEKLVTHDWLVGEVNQTICGYAYMDYFGPGSHISIRWNQRSTGHKRTLGKDLAGLCIPDC